MNVLTISLDKTILTQKFGDAFLRQKKYARFFNKFFIIIFSLKKDKLLQFKKENNVFIYSTNSQSRWLFVFDALKIVNKIIKQNKLDAVTTQDPFLTGFCGWLIKKLYKIPLHIEIHGEFFVNPFWRNQSLQNKAFYFLSQKLIKRADRLRVLTKRQRDFLNKNLAIKKEKISIAPTLVDIDFFKGRKVYKDEVKQGIFVGRFVGEKNLSSLVKALRSVISKYQNFRFLIVGSGELEAKIKNLVKKLSLSKNVLFLGNRPREEVKKLIKESDFLVLPSFSEGYGKVCVESMAFGTPVIMSKTGCASELVINNKTGLVIPISDQKALERAINRFIQNPQSVKKLGIAGRKKVFKIMNKEKTIQKIVNSLKRTTEFKLKEKLVYIVPRIDRRISSHYFHLYELLEKAGENLEIFLFAEKGKGGVNFKNVNKIYIQKLNFLPLRLLERILVFIYLNLIGYKKFYVHISLGSSIIASLLTKIFGGETFFWHCGQIDVYEKETGRKNWLFRWNLKLIDFLVTANKGMKNYYCKKFATPEKKIKILPGWVNIERFKKLSSEKTSFLKRKLKIGNKKVILFVHRLSPRKGSRYLPDIIEETIKKSKDLIFVIVGGGPDKQWLKKELEKRKLLKNVRLIGWASNRQIPYYFKLADCFIMPSREEELGRVQLETMAAGIPLVVFETIGSKNILSKKQKQTMIKNGNTKKFSKAIIYVLENKKGLREEGFKQLSKHSLVKIKEEFIQLIKNI